MTGIYINGASGKMGKNLLERIHLNNDIQICKTIDIDSLDTIIDFSNPDSTIKLLKSLSNDNYAFVIGTTGFNSEQINIIENHAKNKRILLAPNLSKGMAIMKKSIKKFFSSNTEKFNCLITDVHHKDKIDTPSGTALELKKIIINNDENKLIKDIKFNSERRGKVYGIHKVTFFNKSQKIQYGHHTFSRNIYSDGAIEASHWIKDQKAGIYSYDDFLKSQNNL
tara:strand:+ start:692 stop:1363 length:672 start_codon:yes stop_codon:yes gene_type:complete